MISTLAYPGVETWLPVAVEDGEPALRRLGFKLGATDRFEPLFRSAYLPTGWRPTGLYRSRPLHLLDEHRRRRAVVRYWGHPHPQGASMRLVSLREYAVRCVADNTPVIVDPGWATPQALLGIALDETRRAGDRAQLFTTSHLGRQAVHYTALQDRWYQLAARFDVEAVA